MALTERWEVQYNDRNTEKYNHQFASERSRVLFCLIHFVSLTGQHA